MAAGGFFSLRSDMMMKHPHYPFPHMLTEWLIQRDEKIIQEYEKDCSEIDMSTMDLGSEENESTVFPFFSPTSLKDRGENSNPGFRFTPKNVDEVVGVRNYEGPDNWDPTPYPRLDTEGQENDESVIIHKIDEEGFFFPSSDEEEEVIRQKEYESDSEQIDNTFRFIDLNNFPPISDQLKCEPFHFSFPDELNLLGDDKERCFFKYLLPYTRDYNHKTSYIDEHGVERFTYWKLETLSYYSPFIKCMRTMVQVKFQLWNCDGSQNKTYPPTFRNKYVTAFPYFDALFFSTSNEPSHIDEFGSGGPFEIIKGKPITMAFLCRFFREGFFWSNRIISSSNSRYSYRYTWRMRKAIMKRMAEKYYNDVKLAKITGTKVVCYGESAFAIERLDIEQFFESFPDISTLPHQSEFRFPKGFFLDEILHRPRINHLSSEIIEKAEKENSEWISPFALPKSSLPLGHILVGGDDEDNTKKCVYVPLTTECVCSNCKRDNVRFYSDGVERVPPILEDLIENNVLFRNAIREYSLNPQHAEFYNLQWRQKVFFYFMCAMTGRDLFFIAWKNSGNILPTVNGDPDDFDYVITYPMAKDEKRDMFCYFEGLTVPVEICSVVEFEQWFAEINDWKKEVESDMEFYMPHLVLYPYVSQTNQMIWQLFRLMAYTLTNDYFLKEFLYGTDISQNYLSLMECFYCLRVYYWQHTIRFEQYMKTHHYDRWCYLEIISDEGMAFLVLNTLWLDEKSCTSKERRDAAYAKLLKKIAEKKTISDGLREMVFDVFSNE